MQAALMAVTKCRGQRIRGIRRRFALQAEQRGHHMLNLRFRCGAAADNRLFDFPGSILKYGNLECEGRAQGSGASLAEFQCTHGVAMHENTLDDDGIRTVFSDDFSDGAKYQPQTGAEIALDTAHGAAGHVVRTVVLEVEDAESCGAGTGIDTQDALSLGQYLPQSCDSTSSGISALL